MYMEFSLRKFGMSTVAKSIFFWSINLRVFHHFSLFLQLKVYNLACKLRLVVKVNFVIRAVRIKHSIHVSSRSRIPTCIKCAGPFEKVSF